MNLIDVITDTAEGLGWKVSFKQQSRWSDDGIDKLVYFNGESPAGEGLELVEYYEDVEEIPLLVTERARVFDVDEHVMMWMDAKRAGVSGVPSSRVLVQDAEDIEIMMMDLADALAVAVGKAVA